MVVEEVREHLTAYAISGVVAAALALGRRQREADVDDLSAATCRVSFFATATLRKVRNPEMHGAAESKRSRAPRARLHAVRRVDAEQVEPARKHARDVSSQSASRDARVASSGARSTGQFSKNAVNALARS